MKDEGRDSSWVMRHPSAFGTITLSYRKTDRTLSYRQRGGNQSTIDRNGVSLDIYIHALYGLAVQRPGAKVLMIGCAGGTLATMLTRAGRKLTVVDIDSVPFKLARRHFGLPRSVSCVKGDGVAFLQSARATFDIIIVDAFIGEAIPAHFTGESFYKAMRRRLRPGGLALVNVCLHDKKDRLADEIAAGFAARGWDVRLLDEPGAARNAIVAAGDVKGMRRPVVRVEPEVGAADLRKGVRAMRFRKPRKETRKNSLRV